MQLVNVLHFVN